MPPRKKSKPSTAKFTGPASANHQTQPSKFGIQHFFLRHSQLSQSRSLSPSLNPKPLPAPSSSSVPPPLSLLVPTSAPLLLCNSEPQNPHDGPDLRANGSDNMDTDASPEVSKFSPGMLMKQSQDDGGEVITWKISPVNERLRAASKQIHKMMKLSGDSPTLSSSTIRHCSQDKRLCPSPGTASKVEKWLSSPTKRASERSVLSANTVRVKRVDPSPDVEYKHVTADSNDSFASGNSPFQTPPSLSYSHDKFPCNITCNGASEPMGSRQHKKALLELLDQVEDVISVEDPAADAVGSHVPKDKVRDSSNLSFGVDPALDAGEIIQPQLHTSVPSDCYFLVLEVCEKRGSAGSSRVQCPYKVLRLLNEHTGAERALYLWDEWFYSIVSPGDSVNVIGEFDEEGKCDVDHENNFVIVHPDILVAGTKVAASFACPRRTVLDERLRSSEYSAAALIGTLLHQVFQAGLMNDSPTVDFMEEYARIVIEKNIESLYACGVNEGEMRTTLFNAIPRMVNWILSFTNSEDAQHIMTSLVARFPKDLSRSIVDFGSTNGQKKVKLSEVIDIEEMSWAPKYGLKGMIDASVRVIVESNTNTISRTIMPLEFKSGRVPIGQSSMEHCAQVILYMLLMSERYLTHIDTGILYYLQSDQTQGIAVQRSDLVGLIMRRNELANDILKASTTQQLPPMLRNLRMCQGCRHLDVCTIYHKVHGGNTETSGLGDVFDMQISHLSIVHCDFLRHWDRLIDLEAREMQLQRKEIWHSNGPKSSCSASYLSSMVLDVADGLQQQKSHRENRFIYRFVDQNLCQSKGRVSGEDTKSIQSQPTDDLDCRLRIGDHVMLSTELSHVTVASGVVTDVGRFHVSVSFSKQLRLPWSHPSFEVSDLFREVWRIVKDEIVTSFSVMRFNVVQLFLQSAQSAHLRKMIVDLEAPRFDGGSILSQDPAISYIWSEKSLNNDQRQAILKILTAKDYALILGMPGTGKTSTLVHAVKALLIRGSSILLASYTNSAVDNLLIKLKAQGIDFLRVGRHEATHKEVQEHCFSAMDVRSLDDIKTKLDQVKVVATTCLGITSPLLLNRRFDVCIIDEAGQITLPVSLGPLTFASMFVLVGDHYQLPPLVQSTEAREKGMGVSLFCRLSEAHPQAISALRSQYRMCQGIMELSNALIYGDRLCCGSSEVADGKLELSTSKSCSSWLKEVLEPRRSVIFLDTDMLPAFEARDQKAISNPVEARIIVEIAEELVRDGVKGKDIGIITPYNSQASLIQRAVPMTSVEIHTIDKYQGRDKDCILVSFVRSYERPRSSASSLLGDWHRINVALTRAKKKLVMVGSRRTLSQVPLLMLLLKKVDEQSGILTLSGADIKQKGVLKKCSEIR